MNIEFKKFTDFNRGIMYEILKDAYSFDERCAGCWDENWKQSDAFFFDHPAIADKYGFNKEQFILYEGGGFGRADLISSDGQVWDVKRDKPRQIKAGKKQVQKYVENTWARSPDTPLSVGGNEIESGYFYHKSGLTTYKVTYRHAGDGVIAYDYRVSEFDYQTLATTVLVVGVAAAAGIAAGLPSGAIAYLALA